MWRDPLLYRVDAWAIALGLCLAMVAATWAGHRVGVARGAGESASARAESTAEIGPIEGAIAGLLGLVVAFSFTMAAQRFDARQHIIVGEANAIGTAFLRCSVLELDDRRFCQDQLGVYLDQRIAYNVARRDDARIEASLRRAGELQRSLWARLAALARERPTPVNALTIQALNDVIDRQGDSVASRRIVVPPIVSVGELLLCVVWAAVAGYGYGLKKNEKRGVWLAFSALVALTVFVTLDFDRPRRGFIGLDEGTQSMVDLRESIRAGRLGEAPDPQRADGAP